MWPTLRPGDVLHVEVGAPESFRVGDVLVFSDGISGELTAHRLVLRDSNGLIFRGDNNDMADSVVSAPESVVGRVCGAERNDRLIPIYGGFRGQIQGLRGRIGKTLRRRLRSLIEMTREPISRVVKKWGWGLNTRTVRFGDENGAEYHLYWRGRFVGKYGADKQSRQIRLPYRLFIDESKLKTGK
jgi:hypothetical protein